MGHQGTESSLTPLHLQSVLDAPGSPKTASGEAWRGDGTGVVPGWYHRGTVQAVLRSEKVSAFLTLPAPERAVFLPYRFILDESVSGWALSSGVGQLESGSKLPALQTLRAAVRISVSWALGTLFLLGHRQDQLSLPLQTFFAKSAYSALTAGSAQCKYIVYTLYGQHIRN